MREGWIELSTGEMWRVVHAPEAQLPETLTSRAVEGVLAGGLLIALLLGALAYQTGRAGERAREAGRAEDELRRLNLDLERRIEERTEDLDEALHDLRIVPVGRPRHPDSARRHRSVRRAPAS